MVLIKLKILFSKAKVMKSVNIANKPVVAKAMTRNLRNQIFKDLFVKNPIVMAPPIVACKSEDWDNVTLQ